MTLRSSTDSRLGTVLHGRYRILARLAAGGMGVIYRGERVGLARPVAIKFLIDPSGSPDARRRFEIEARAASRLSHPNCVAVIDAGLDGDTPYIVMDLVPGETLRAIMRRGSLSIAHALGIGRQVLAGLAHAHAHGVVHRDVKPENVLVWCDASDEHAQLTDFGLAHLDEMASRARHVAVGTPSYMSPEQTRGDPVDARADVYAMGVLLFELLAERKPYISRSLFELLQLHRDAPIPAFDDVAPERRVPLEIERVVRRALAKAPDDRYASAVELSHALAEAMTDAKDMSERVPLDELLAASRARSRWLAPVGVIAIIGALIAGTATLHAHRASPRAPAIGTTSLTTSATHASLDALFAGASHALHSTAITHKGKRAAARSQ